MIQHLIKFEQDMDQVIHGVNKQIKSFSLSNYSLTTQIIIINLSTTFFALVALIFFNFFLLNSNKNLNDQKELVTNKLDEISNYLSKNAIKRILTFNDNCIRVLKEENSNCNQNEFINRNYEDKLPQLDPTYTQQYIYSNFLDTQLTIKVFAEDWTKFADTAETYAIEEEIIISDISDTKEEKTPQNQGFYFIYKHIYFNIYNFFQEYLDKKKLQKINKQNINDNFTVMETIKTKKSTSYIYKDQENNFKTKFSSPILKDKKVYGVVTIIAPFTFDNNESAVQSFLLTNFFLFFISIMFFLSVLFFKSIIKPIKILSHNTQLERDKSSSNKMIIAYPNRKDEIGKLSHDIKNMSNDLKKRIKETEQFAADVSHELKNPLSGLKSSSDLLIANKLDEESKKLLVHNMSSDIQRMNILITDIANYTLTQVEISEESFETINLINFLYDFKSSLSNDDYIITIQSFEKEVFINVNKNKFTQVLHNLLDNAFSFAKLQTKILINITTKYQQCFIDIVDQGPGISLEYKDKIFERFYTDRDQSRNEHTGLGLSISRSIIESFDGSINLNKSSYFGFNGACFEIRLPLKDLKKFI